MSFIRREVELSDERQRHIAETHPELLPAQMNQIPEGDVEWKRS